MFRAVALVPSPPLLVPELTGGGASEADDVRVAALDAATVLGVRADRWLAIGVDDHAQSVSPDSLGTFRGYGVDVEVGLSPGAREALPSMPLAALIAAWLRTRTSPQASVEAVIVGSNTEDVECARIGRDLRARMDSDAENWGLLVVADGATTLTLKAPGSFDDRAPQVQNSIDDALDTADIRSLAGFDRYLCRELGVGGAAAWKVLAGAVDGDVVVSKTLYRGAPFGVGYFVGTWETAR